MTLEPLQLLQPTPKSLLFNIYHSCLGPQLLADPAPAWPSGPLQAQEGMGEQERRGGSFISWGPTPGGMELVLEGLEQETESNPTAGKGLKGQFQSVPHLGTMVKLL